MSTNSCPVANIHLIRLPIMKKALTATTQKSSQLHCNSRHTILPSRKTPNILVLWKWPEKKSKISSLENETKTYHVLLFSWPKTFCQARNLQFQKSTIKISFRKEFMLESLRFVPSFRRVPFHFQIDGCGQPCRPIHIQCAKKEEM